MEERHAEIETIKADYDEQLERIQVGGVNENRTIFTISFSLTSMIILI